MTTTVTTAITDLTAMQTNAATSSLSKTRATPTSHHPQSPALPSRGVDGGPRLVLRAEGATLFFAAVFAYTHLDFGAISFAALFLAPDLAMLGYLAGPRIGAAAYNAAHSTLTPLVIGTLTFTTPHTHLAAISLIWLAHIGFDRMLGYGLKYATGFRTTHLGLIGKPQSPADSPSHRHRPR